MHYAIHMDWCWNFMAEKKTWLQGSMDDDLNMDAKTKALELRRMAEEILGIKLEGLESDEDYSEVVGRCCENIIGYKRVPLGISNRTILINEHRFLIPVATTEGALVASMCRGIKLINMCGGIRGYAENVGISRGFVVRFRDFEEAIGFYKWIRERESVERLKRVGNSSSRYLRISRIESRHVVGNEVYVKVHGYTGDAMGMNMITKGCTEISDEILRSFPGSVLVCISSNTCGDKKWSAENYCNGRGRRVFMSMSVGDKECKEMLGVGVEQLLEVYQSKVVVGSSLVLGGANSQAANFVAGMFLALGQDLGHVAESSNCVLHMRRGVCGDLEVSLVMPSVIVGVVGGGTHLEPTRSLLKQFDIPDRRYMIAGEEEGTCAPGYLALAIGGAVLAGELSLLGSLADNTLMEAHLRLNRKK